MMLEILHYLNGGACALLAALLLWCVMSVRVDDRLLIKTGLISMAFGSMFIGYLMFTADEPTPIDAITINKAFALFVVGALVVLSGYFYRRHRAGKSLRVISDVMPLGKPLERDFNDSQYGFPHTDTRP